MTHGIHRPAWALLIALTVSFASPMGAGVVDKTEWIPQLEDGLERAQADERIVLLALGESGEGRTKRHEEELYSSKAAAPFLALSVNVPAWSFIAKEEKKLPDFGGAEALDHRSNLAAIKERWVTANDKGVVALPQHVWLSSAGEVLLSCPWEMTAEEFTWCSAEALRRAGVEEIPELPEGARPPRRLLLGETFRVTDADELGRGLEPAELSGVIKKLNKRFVTMRDYGEVLQILFSAEDDAVEYISKQIGVWDLGGQTRGIVDGAIGLLGQYSTEGFIEVLEKEAKSDRVNRRAQVAVALEQIGSVEGLKIVKKAWKKEKDDVAKAEWIRALAACGWSDKGTVKTILKVIDKEKSLFVRKSAILAAGYLLPHDDTADVLETLARSGDEGEREAAILALALGRNVASKEMLTGLMESGPGTETVTAVEAALSVLDGGNLHLIDQLVAKVSESEIRRDRVFFRATIPRFNIPSRR